MASISCCLHARVFLIRIAQLRVLPDDRFSQCATWAAHAAPLLRELLQPIPVLATATCLDPFLQDPV